MANSYHPAPYNPSRMPIYHPANPASPSNPMNPLSPVWIGRHHSQETTATTQSAEQSPVVTTVKAGEMSGECLAYCFLAGIILSAILLCWICRPRIVSDKKEIS